MRNDSRVMLAAVRINTKVATCQSGKEKETDEERISKRLFQPPLNTLDPVLDFLFFYIVLMPVNKVPQKSKHPSWRLLTVHSKAREL